MKHSEYVEILKNQGKDILKKVLIKVAVEKLPFLAFGPANILLAQFMSWLATEAMKKGEMAIFFQYIDFRTDDQAKEFESLMIRNATIQKIGTEDEKRAIEKELEGALLKLVNLRK